MTLKQPICVWMGDFGMYQIPPELVDTPIRADGLPDGRSPAKKAALLKWVGERDAIERAKYV